MARTGVTRPPSRAPGVRGNAAFVRYTFVGIFNTLVDLGLFTVLAVVAKLEPVVANVISTTFTLCVSYLLNRRFVFRTDRSVRATVVPFVAVTLFSGLIVQSTVIWTVVHLGGLITPGFPMDVLDVFAKICAMGVGMASNFLGYRWLFGHR